jgi:acyl dehydratase
VTTSKLAFEDFQVGDVLPLAPHEVTSEAVMAFATMFDPQPMHLDEEAARETLLGGLSASGWHTCAMFMRMMCDGFLLASTSLGAPAVETLKWLKPVRPGDRLTGRSIVLDIRASKSRPEMGVVRFRHEIENQAGDIVMWMENPIMFARRAEAKP